jgi:hypothetical protein
MSGIAFTQTRITKEDLTLSLLTGAGLSFLMAWNIYPYLSDGQEYKDLVTGSLIWFDYDKDQEWKALNMLFAGFIFFSMGMIALFHYLRTRDAGQWISAVHRLFWLAWLPAVFWFGTALMRPNMPFFLLNLSGIWVLLFVYITMAFARKSEEVTSGDVIEAGFCSVLVLVFGVFSILAVTTVVAQFSMPLRTLLLNKGSGDLVSAGSVLAIGFICWNLSFSKSLLQIKKRFHRGLLLLQIALPFLLFVEVSQYYFYQNSMIRMYQSTGLIILACALVLFSWYKLYRRYQRAVQAESAKEALTHIDLLSPASLYPIAIFVGGSFFSGYSFAIDDFHIGEQLLPWQQIVDFGKLPYFDFAPIHGLMAFAYGGLNAWFYDGTVATFPQAMSLLMAVFMGLSFWTLYSFAGPWPALILTPFLGMTFDRLYCLVPGLLLYGQLFSGNWRITTWLPLWILLGLISVLYNVPIGAGLILGSLPLVLYRGWLEFKEYQTWLRRFFLLMLASAAGIVLISPVRQVAFGFLHFVLDNASTNTIANGIGILQGDERPKDIGFAATQFQWIFLKLSWIVFIFAVTILLFRTLIERVNRPDSKYIVLLAMIPITFFIIGKWSLERISPGYFSPRDGALSFLALAFFLPLIQVGFGADSTRSLRYLTSALIIGIMASIAGVVPDYNALLARPTLTNVINDKRRLVSGQEIGIPRLGKLFADPQRIDELQSLRKAMALFLKPGETFLDLTNHSALYYYLDMPVPVVYSSDYVAANTKSLTRIIEQIKENPPPLVLIAPRIPFDGGPASLRSYLLYRELATSYTPEVIGAHTFLIRPDRLGSVNPKPLPAQLDILDSAFRARDLYAIPNAWGRSWEQLKERFTVVQRVNPAGIYNFTHVGATGYRPTGEDPHFIFDIGQYHFAGKEVDFILVDYSCERPKSGPDPVLELYWETKNDPQSENTVLRFFGSGAKALIPVGAQPRWLLAERIESFRLDLQNPQSCSELRLNKVEMLRLN